MFLVTFDGFNLYCEDMKDALAAIITATSTFKNVEMISTITGEVLITYERGCVTYIAESVKYVI